MTQGTNPNPASLNEVLAAELEQLRPGSLKGIAPAELSDPDDKKKSATLREIYARSHEQELSALCLSGGGIRSATFNLGVIQGLAKIGLLGKFDYLSSVSGGGYIASWLRTWMARETVEKVVAALKGPKREADPLAPEPQPLVDLREYSNYLTPHLGLISGDTWAAAAIIGRNMLLNWLVLFPMIAAVVGIPLFFRLIVHGTGIASVHYKCLLYGSLAIEFLAALGVFSFRRFAKTPGIPQGYFILGCVAPVWIAGAVLCTAALGLNLQNDLQHVCCSDLRNLWKFSFGWCLFVPFCGWLLVQIAAWFLRRPQPQRLAAWKGERAAWMYEAGGIVLSGCVGAWLFYLAVRYLFVWLHDNPSAYVVLALPILLAIYLGSRALFVALASLGDSSKYRGSNDDADREWWSRLSGWLLLLLCSWIVVTSICLFGLWLADWFQGFRTEAPPSATVINTVKSIVSVFGAVSGVLAAFTGSSAKTPGKDSWTTPTMTKLLINSAAVVFLICVVILLSWGLRWLGQWFTGEQHLFADPMPWPVWMQFFCLLAALACLSFAVSRPVNVNRFSMHGMYRNRLVRAYLGASNTPYDKNPDPRSADPFTGFSLTDNVPLHKVWLSAGSLRSDSIDPAQIAQIALSERRLFPIINTTLNLVSGQKLAWQQRKSESFSMTPLYCGSWSEGYRRTFEYGGRNGVSVGTAMTISGAAANPNMGYNSSPVLAFIMSIFNVRLGAWLGNPNKNGNGGYRRTGPRTALVPLFAEVFGITNANRRYVNLSDGGHFDNLGLYEIVLRRCKNVLVSDAGNDGSFAFEDLGNAIRKIRIDFGIPIEFKEKIEILPNPPINTGKSTDKPPRPGLYCAIATIKYSAIDGVKEADKEKEAERAKKIDGTLIYIKPTLRGHVPHESGGEVPYDVYSYARSSDDFPHESTVDQWFSESQFESYRELGSHILRQLGDPQTDASFKDFLQSASDHIKAVRKHNEGSTK